MQQVQQGIPVQRIIEKLDESLSRNDYTSAEKLLSYWLSEAEECGDASGKLTILNEQIGLYRKTAQEAKCLSAIDAAMKQTKSLKPENAVTLGTTYINAATGFRAFGRTAEAAEFYEKAKGIYESHLQPDDGRLAALYNNMAVTLGAQGRYSEAEAFFAKALAILPRQKNGKCEAAVTYLNLADLAYARLGPEYSEIQIREYLEKAEILLDSADIPRDGYYAFTCEKCAPVFGYYGYFLTERKLVQAAKEIYERA